MIMAVTMRKSGMSEKQVVARVHEAALAERGVTMPSAQKLARQNDPEQ